MSDTVSCKRATGTGWKYTENGITIVHLAGSFYDMGYQHADLLRNESEVSLRAIESTIRKEYKFIPVSLILRYIHHTIYKKQKQYIPIEFKEEMKGGADASGVPQYKIEALHALTYLTSCAGAIGWGRATKEGNMYFTKSNDTYFTIDHKRKKVAHPLIMVYSPVEGIPFLMVTWPGYIGASGGINAEGITIDNLNINSSREQPSGIPMIFRVKNALLHAKTLDEAVALLTARPFEGGYSFMVADGKIPNAKIIEMDADSVYVGDWNGPAESNSYMYRGTQYTYTPLEDFIIRTNHPLSSQVFANYKSTIDSESKESCFTGPRYRALKTEYQKQWGNLTIDSMLGILRSVYQAIGKDSPNCYPVVTHQYSVCPQSGELLLSISGGNPIDDGNYSASAYNQPIHKFNVFSLLKMTYQGE